MNRIVRYIGAHVISAILIVVAVISGIEFFITFLGQVSDIGQYNYGFSQAFCYVALQLPQQLYAVFPMIGFLGGLLALDKLSSGSELIVMRTSGFSKLRITYAVMLASAVVLVVVTLIGEILAPRASQMADDLRNRSLHVAPLGSTHGAWLKHNNTVVNIARTVSASRLENISGFDFDKGHRLQKAWHASSGKLIDGRWRLFDVRETLLRPKRVWVSHRKFSPLGLYYSPSFQSSTKGSALHKSAFELWHVVRYLKAVGLSSREFQFQFWVRVFRPFSILLMIALGVPFVFGSLRHSSRGARVALGVIVGFAFYMLNQIFGPVTLILQCPPFIAAAAPSVLFLIIYLSMMKRLT